MARILAFLAWPLIEICLFIWIGGMIGVGATLAWILLTGIIGVMILRRQAQQGAVLVRSGMARGSLRDGAPAASLFRALAAMLLILPGFLTDALGLLLLLPPVQMLLSTAILQRVSTFAAGRFGSAGFGPAGFGASNGPRTNGTHTPDSDVIDGEWVEVPPQAKGKRPPSGWTEIDG